MYEERSVVGKGGRGERVGYNFKNLKMTLEQRPKEAEATKDWDRKVSGKWNSNTKDLRLKCAWCSLPVKPNSSGTCHSFLNAVSEASLGHPAQWKPSF